MRADARAAMKLENPCCSASKIVAGAVQAIPNRARALLVERKNAARARKALRFFINWVQTRPVRARKCASEAQ